MTTHEQAFKDDQAAADFRDGLHAYFSKCPQMRWELEENDPFNEFFVRIWGYRNNDEYLIEVGPTEDYKIQVRIYEEGELNPLCEFVTKNRSDVVDWLEVFCR